MLVKCWKVAHWDAKKLLKNCQKSKTLLPTFQKLPPKFLDIFIQTVIKSFIFCSSQKLLTSVKEKKLKNKRLKFSMKRLTFSCLIYMCSKPIFCSKVAQKGKICSRLLEPQKVAPNAKTLFKSCQAQSGKGGAG